MTLYSEGPHIYLTSYCHHFEAWQLLDFALWVLILHNFNQAEHRLVISLGVKRLLRLQVKAETPWFAGFLLFLGVLIHFTWRLFFSK